MTYSSIVEQNQKNCQTNYCQTSQQSPLSSRYPISNCSLLRGPNCNCGFKYLISWNLWLQRILFLDIIIEPSCRRTCISVCCLTYLNCLAKVWAVSQLFSCLVVSLSLLSISHLSYSYDNFFINLLRIIQIWSVKY
jgi:hypothetical protein